MIDNFEDHDAEAMEEAGREARLLADERDWFQAALNGSLEIFTAPGEADPDFVHDVTETLEEFRPYFADTRISDCLGEVIELLHDVCDESLLDFEEAQDGKRAVEVIADALDLELTYPEDTLDCLGEGRNGHESL